MRTHQAHEQPELLRHACAGCGGCCQGFRVLVRTPDEREKVLEAARVLAIPDPIEGDALRSIDGACVFLRADDRCAIHASLGAAHKPGPCRQFPLVVTKAEDGVRVGIDPSSWSAWSTWRGGPPVPEGPVIAGKSSLPGGQLELERSLVARCEAGGTVGELISALTGERSVGGAVPAGFASRWADVLSRYEWASFLDRDGPGRRLRATLAPMASAAPTWSAGAPPAAVWTEAQTEWTLECVRRTLYLRLMSDLPSPALAALLLAGGALATAWAAPDRYGQTWTGWLRAVRFAAFWRGVVRDGDTLRWLATGRPRD